MSTALPRRATRQELAVLEHPDQRSSWAVLLEATLMAPIAFDAFERRLDELHASVPLIGARRSGALWVAGRPAPLTRFDQLSELGGRFSLEHEPPLRVALDEERGRVALSGHHAAFDGRSLVALVASLAGGSEPGAVADDGAASSGRPKGRSVLSRLVRPADRVTASRVGRAVDAMAAVTLDTGAAAGSFTARLVDACVAAVAAHNDRAGSPLRRISVSIGIAGAGGVGNNASYQRIDVTAGEPVAAVVDAGLRGGSEPRELAHPEWLRLAGPLLRPIVSRLGDTLLVSNLGRMTVPGVRRIAFHPVARGPSAVAFGAATVVGGESVLTIRARDLDDADANAIVKDAASRFR